MGGLTVAGMLGNEDAANAAEDLADFLIDMVKDVAEAFGFGNDDSEEEKNVGDSKTTTSNPVPDPNNDDDEDKEFSTQYANDAKKLNNKGADNFSKENGYDDAYDLKKDILKGQRDKTVGHYDIFVNNKTNQAFLINKSKTVIIPILP